MTLHALDGGQDARYAALLEIIDPLASGQALPQLLTQFAASLAPAVRFDDCVVAGLAPQDGSSRALALHVAGAITVRQKQDRRPTLAAAVL